MNPSTNPRPTRSGVSKAADPRQGRESADIGVSDRQASGSGTVSSTRRSPGTPQAQGQSVPTAWAAVKTNAQAWVTGNPTRTARLPHRRRPPGQLPPGPLRLTEKGRLGPAPAGRRPRNSGHPAARSQPDGWEPGVWPKARRKTSTNALPEEQPQRCATAGRNPPRRVSGQRRARTGRHGRSRPAARPPLSDSPPVGRESDTGDDQGEHHERHSGDREPADHQPRQGHPVAALPRPPDLRPGLVPEDHRRDRGEAPGHR